MEEVYLEEKSKRKYFKIFGIIFLILILIIGGLYIYATLSIKNGLKISSSLAYIYISCFDYCPFEGQLYDENRILPNYVCYENCVDKNFGYEELEKMSEIYNKDFSLINIFYSDDEIREMFYNNSVSYDTSSCVIDIYQYKDNSCIKEYLEKYKENDPGFVEPTYQDISFNFTSISCDEEGIIVDFEVIEGSISGLQIIFYDGGNSDYIKRLQSFEKGKHKIGISKEEYTKRLDSPNRVQLAYIFDVGGRAQIAPATQIISCN